MLPRGGWSVQVAVAAGAAAVIAVAYFRHTRSDTHCRDAGRTEHGHEHVHSEHDQAEHHTASACRNPEGCCNSKGACHDNSTATVQHSHVEARELGERLEHAPTEPPLAKAPPPASGPPPLGAILQLAKETGKPRKECRAALSAHANDYEAAKAFLSPPPPEIEAAAPTLGTAVDGLYEPSAKFAGGRPGWMFKTGPLGTGYYRDAPMDVALPKKA